MAKSRTRRSSPDPDAPAGLPGFLTAPSGWRWWLRMTLLVLVLLAVLYTGAMFRGETFLSGDAGNSLAFASVGDRSLAAGHYPLWNPYLFAGMPSFGSLAYVRYLYPPSVLFNFLQTHLGFPPLTWMFGHLLMGGLGMAWLLRRWKLHFAAVAVGVAFWLLFPKVVAWGVHGHGSKLGAAMYLPWLTGTALGLLDDGRWRRVGVLGLLTGLLLLRGHIQIAYYSLGLVAWLTLWGVVWPPEPRWRGLTAGVRLGRAGRVALGLALGFLVAAILLLPVHEYAAISIRGQASAGGGVGLDYATGWSLSPRELPTFVLPSAAGFGQATYMGLMPFTDYPNYYGILVLLLAGLAWGQGRRRWLIATGTLAVLAVLVSFGNFGFGLYEALYRWLPFFNKFRVPSMILILPAFLLAVAAARGAQTLVEDAAGRDTTRPMYVSGALGLLLLLGGLGAARGMYAASLQSLAAAAGKTAAPVLVDAAWGLHRADLIRIGVLLLAAAGAFRLTGTRTRPGRGVLAWSLCFLLAVDLAAVDHRITHPEDSLLRIGRGAGGQAALMPAPALAAPYQPTRAEPGPHAEILARAVGHDRIYPLGANGSRNTWMADGIRSLGGYHPAKLAAYETIRKRLYSGRPAGRIASWLSGRVVTFDTPFSPQELALLEDLGLALEPRRLTDAAPYAYRAPGALPRARLVGRWEPVSSLPGGTDLPSFLDALQSGQVDPAAVVHLPDDQAAELPASATVGPEDPSAVTFVRDDLDEVVLETSHAAPAVLVLADMNAPGWSVEVDGAEKPLLRADLVLRGVYLPPGDHEVRFVFRDPSVRLGLVLSLCGLAVILILLAGGWFAARRASAAGGAEA